MEAVLQARVHYRCGQLTVRDQLWVRLPAFAQPAVSKDRNTGLLAYQEAVIQQTPLQFPINDVVSSVASGGVYIFISLLCAGLLVEGPSYGLTDASSENGGGIFKLLVEWLIASGRVDAPLVAAFRAKLVASLTATRVTNIEAWTWIRHHRNNWFGWSILLSRPIQTIDITVHAPTIQRQARTIENPITRSHLQALARNRTPLNDWHRHIGLVLPGTREGTTTLKQIWSEAVDQTNAIMLARAYYRTGQLPVFERPLVLMLHQEEDRLRFEPILPNADELPLDGRLMFRAFITANQAAYDQKATEFRNAVRLAVSTFNPEQLMLYRLYMFIAIAYSVLDTILPAPQQHPQRTYKGAPNEIISKFHSSLRRSLPRGRLNAAEWFVAWQAAHGDRWTAAWRDALSHREEYEVLAYISYYNSMLKKQEHSNQHYIKEAYKALMSRWAKYPILTCYRELLVNATLSWQDGSIELEPRTRACPTLYAPVRMGVSPTLKALGISQLADLSGLIGSYASAPTFEEVLDRMAVL